MLWKQSVDRNFGLALARNLECDGLETMVAMGLASTPPPLDRARREPGELNYIYNEE
ncbi:MAG: hypothetical protein NTV34_14635 [Proteobacteria bacterium]|nr:hypothetical protein [Pseudomonadota bacterium]